MVNGKTDLFLYPQIRLPAQNLVFLAVWWTLCPFPRRMVVVEGIQLLEHAQSNYFFT